ncbi:phage tail protein I [Novosphingobium humi]|uniref:phage tail protein I n=1 Tax=Novosphingobium humi TaxID=2282397 RepID=UPI0025AF359F|nr:phage tail protein I [Novosphingobium humi]WJS97846.1 phage tail protein I [Novosphingobium humi]
MDSRLARVNLTPLWRGLLSLTDRFGLVSIPLPALTNPNYTPIGVLPWLAWGLAVDRWPATWSEARQRQEVAQAIPNHKRRGSRRSMDLLLAEYDATLQLVEWHEAGGSGIPRTFTVILPTNGAEAGSITASFAADLLADIERTKPAGTLFDLRQSAVAAVALPVTVAARAMVMARSLGPIAQPDPADLLNITTEYGEPLEGADGAVWEYI